MPAIPTPGKFWEDACMPTPDYEIWFRAFSSFLRLLDLDREDGDKLADANKNDYLLLLLGQAGAAQFAPNPLAGLAATTTFDAFSAAVRTTFVRPVSLVRARFDFSTRRQGTDETAADYAIELRRLAGLCKFRQATEVALIDSNIAVQLALGCRSTDAQRKLLEEEEPNVDKFLAILSADERSRQECAAIHGESTPAVVGALSRGARGGSHRPRDNHHGGAAPQGCAQASCAGSQDEETCENCGYEHAATDRCPAASTACRRCGVMGHWAHCCRAAHPVPKNTAKAMEGLRLGMVSVSAAARSSDSIDAPLLCDLELKTGPSARFQRQRFEVDTGAAVSALRASDCYRLFGHCPVRPARRPLLNADGSRVSGVRGICDLISRFGGRVCNTEFYVVSDRCSNVIGRQQLIRCLEIPCIDKDLLKPGEYRASTQSALAAQGTSVSSWRPRKRRSPRRSATRRSRRLSEASTTDPTLPSPPTAPPTGTTAVKARLHHKTDLSVGRDLHETALCDQGDVLAASLPALPDAPTQGVVPFAGLSVDELRKASAVDEDLKEVGRYGRTFWPKLSKLPSSLRPYFYFRAALSNSGGYFTRTDTRQVCVPAALHPCLLACAHCSGHGAAHLKRLLRADYWWPTLDGDVEKLTRDCALCWPNRKLARSPSSAAAAEDDQEFWL